MLCIDDLEERSPPMHGANIAFAVIEQKYKANLSALDYLLVGSSTTQAETRT